MEGHFYAGAPINETYPNRIILLNREGYVCAYDSKRGNPAWVAYCITMAKEHEEHQRPSSFKTDDKTNARVAHKDYTHSGYDRGHMAPNEAISESYGRQAQLETFLMSNVVPQQADLNRGPWRQLEQDLVDRVMDKQQPVWVITGPIYTGEVETMPNGKVEIPDAFFKIAVSSEGERLWTFSVIMPQSVQRKQKLSTLRVSIDAIEQQTGFDYLSELDDQVESKIEAR